MLRWSVPMMPGSNSSRTRASRSPFEALTQTSAARARTPHARWRNTPARPKDAKATRSRPVSAQPGSRWNRPAAVVTAMSPQPRRLSATVLESEDKLVIANPLGAKHGKELVVGGQHPLLAELPIDRLDALDLRRVGLAAA